MENIGKKYKSIVTKEKEQIDRLFGGLKDIKDGCARFSIACEIRKDSVEFDLGV